MSVWDGLAFTATPSAAHSAGVSDRGVTVWDCVILFGGRAEVFKYAGSVHPPSLADVIGCIVRESWLLETCDSVEDYAAQLWIDADDWVHDAYTQAVDDDTRLRFVLGHGRFERFRNHFHPIFFGGQ